MNQKKWGVVNPHAFIVTTSEPDKHAGLQAVDYYLWALQRAFELDDFGRFEQLRNAYRLIIDVDDCRDSPSGRWYCTGYPFTREQKKPFEG